DDVDDVVLLHRIAHGAPFVRSSGPKAWGRISVRERSPFGVRMRHPAPPCSHNSWRHRPHGMSVSPRASTHQTATSRPPPVRTRSLTSPHSAHRPTAYEAFSTLHALSSRPSSAKPATPTGKPE